MVSELEKHNRSFFTRFFFPFREISLIIDVLMQKNFLFLKMQNRFIYKQNVWSFSVYSLVKQS